MRSAPMAMEPPPNIMKAGQRPARVRTGAKTATKGQERDMLEKLRFLAENPEALVPAWLGKGRSPFGKLERKLTKARSLRGKKRRLRWMGRGKHLWNGYAASLVVLEGGKVPSFASLKFQGRDVKFVYRTGTGRNALIGVQHYDDPQVRLLGYINFAKRNRIYLLSGEDRFVALPRGAPAPRELLVEFVSAMGLDVELDGDTVRCPHAAGNTWRYQYDLADLDWHAGLCVECVQDLGGTLHDALDRRILGPDKRLKIARKIQGHAYELRPEATVALYEGLVDKAFAAALRHADDTYTSYSDVELATWTKERLLKLLEERPEGFLLVGDDLWLTDYEHAAETYGDTDLERRALKAAFQRTPPRMRVGDESLHKILEPGWAQHAKVILGELAGGLLKDQELDQLSRLHPSEALASLARVLGARERVKEFLQFDNLHPVLDFVVTCFQVHRSGESAILKGKLQAGAKDPATRLVTLALARQLGEHAIIEWQFAPHEKDAASFLEPYVHEVLNATPQKFAETLGKLAGALNLPAPEKPATT